MDRFRAKFYRDVSEYEGYAFLKAWKTTGEVGQHLLTPEETVEEWANSFRKKA